MQQHRCNNTTAITSAMVVSCAFFLVILALVVTTSLGVPHCFYGGTNECVFQCHCSDGSLCDSESGECHTGCEHNGKIC